MLRHVSSLAAIVLTAAALAACSGAVTEGDGGSSTSGTGGSDPTGGNPTGGEPTGGDPTGGDPTGGDPSGGNPTGGNPTGGGPAGALALANTRAQMDVLWDEYWQNHPTSSGSSGSSSGGDPLDPNDLFLRFADVGVTCASPTADVGCGSHWQVAIVVPPALQQVGVYDLEDPALLQYSVMWETGPVEPGGECWGGGGSVVPGTLEITHIDANQVDFVVTLDAPFDADPSGTYSAERCQ